jgi:hypothetical protein
VPGPDPVLLVAALPGAAGVLAYGPGPGLEFIPYFLGLLTWAGLALAAVLLAPVSALLRRLRKGRGARRAEPGSPSTTASVPESPGEGSHDRA